MGAGSLSFSLPLFGKLGDHELVRAVKQSGQLAPIQRVADALLLNPHRPREIGRRDDAISFDQLREPLRCALEGNGVRRFETDDGKHLAADAEDQIVVPLDVFRRVGQGTADGADGVNGH